MKLDACRDCGETVPAEARGCWKCARNVEAERMVTRYLLLGGAAAVLLLLAGFVVLLLVLRRWRA